MCQKNYNKKSKEKKYQHLNYVEKHKQKDGITLKKAVFRDCKIIK